MDTYKLSFTAQEIDDKLKENTLELAKEYTDEKCVLLSENMASPIVIGAEGDTISVNNSDAKPLRGLKMFGKTTQEKTTGAQLVDISKVDCSNASNGSVITSVTDTEFRVVYDGVYSETIAIFSFTGGLYLDPGTYVMSVDKPLPFSFRFGHAFEPKLMAGQTNLAFTVNARTDLNHIAAEFNTSIGAFDISFKFMVQKGDTASPWEPYTGGVPSPSMQYPQEMESVGDSGSITVTANDQNLVVDTPDGLHGYLVTTGGNYIDADGQMWIADERDIIRGVNIQRIKKIVFNGTEAWTKSAATACDQYTCKVVELPKDKTSLMCDKFSVGVDHVVGHCYFYDNIFGCNPYAAGTSTLADWKAYLAANPMTVIYVLATPVETELAAEQLYSGYPSTEVTNDADAHMVVEYVADIKTFINEQIAAEIVHDNSNAITTVKGASYACFFEQSHYIKTYKPYFQTNTGTYTCRIYETTDGLPMHDGAMLVMLKEITANCGDAVNIDMLISPDRCIWVDPGSTNMLLETITEPAFKALIAGVDAGKVKNIENMRGIWWIAGEFVELVEPVASEVISRMDKVEETARKTTVKSDVFVSKDGGEYETITEALSGYDNNSTLNILVDKGTYEEVLNVGVVDGLTIRGVSREHCVIQNKTGQYKNAPITISGNFLIENLTLKMTLENEVPPTYVFPEGYPGYAIHIDSGSKNSNKENFGVVRNCALYSEAFPAIGLGTHKNQTIILENCILIRNTTKDNYKLDTHRGGLIAHAAGNESDVNQRLIIRDCVIRTNYGMTGNIRTDVGPIENMTVTFINNVFYSEELGFDCFDFVNGESMLDAISHGNTSSNLNSGV